MRIESIGPNFTALEKTKQAQKYLYRLPYDKYMEIEVMRMDNLHKKVNTYLSTFVRNGRERLQAEVGHKTFEETFYRNPVKVVRKALKFANKLEAEQDAQRALTKDMNIPNLG